MATNGFLAFRWTLTTGRRSPGEVWAWSAPFPILPFLFATWGIGHGRKLVVIPRFQLTETIGASRGSAPATIQLPFPWRPRFLMTMARQFFFGHAGAVPGYLCFAWRDPKRGMTIVWFGSSTLGRDRSASGRFERILEQALFDLTLEQPHGEREDSGHAK